MKDKQGFQKGHKFFGDLSHPHFYKKGQRPSIKTEFKKGEQSNKKTPFKKGHVPFNKGKEFRHSKSFGKGERHWNWNGGHSIQKPTRIKPEQYEICGAMGRICYDHDHKTGKFRGWLCYRCNTGLGMVKDNIEILQTMVDYLMENNANSKI